MVAITLDGVLKSFSGGRLALDRVDLKIARGEFLAILGPSGSGKSTLLRILAGLCAPSSGRVLFGERDASGLSPSDRDAAIMFQSQSLFPHLRVRQNLEFSAVAHGTARSIVRDSTTSVAKLLGLADRLESWPSQLSGGQRQRVAIGRIMVRKPSLVLLDEPFSNLDPPLRGRMAEDVRQLHTRTGATTILVTHEPREAASLADRILFLDAGRIIQMGSPSEFHDSPTNGLVASFFGVGTGSCRR